VGKIDSRMRERLIKAAFAAIVMGLSACSVPAQNDEKCLGPIYTAKEVTRRTKITEDADFSVIYKAFGNGIQAHAVVEAVLCRSGRVTDIKVIEISPPKIQEFVVSAVSLIGFKPAEMNYHTVSERLRFEFSINGGSSPGIESAVAAGRLIESLDIMGNRRFTAKEVLSWMKTRAGEPLKAEQIQEDLNTILATGFFNKSGTRVFIEEGVRGGVGVYFEVHELPVIGDVSFEGLKIDQAVIRKAWQDAGIKMQAGAPFSVEALKAAIDVVKQVLDSYGLSYSSVELRAELLTLQTTNLVFVVTTK
jgi:hypothetical protein